MFLSPQKHRVPQRLTHECAFGNPHRPFILGIVYLWVKGNLPWLLGGGGVSKLDIRRSDGLVAPLLQVSAVLTYIS